MHNVLVILLHRPFVADGHLYNKTTSEVAPAHPGTLLTNPLQ